MYYALTERENLVAHLPPGGVAAEIGVAQGDFAAVLLEKAKPSKLHLIDPWSHLESDLLGGAALLDGAKGGNGLAPPPENAEGDKQFAAIRARFAAEPRVALHRHYSYRVVPTFADRQFDFVYIDGNHTYEFVLRDLRDCAAKVKEDGLILGHDFFEDAFAAEQNYAVIDAVNAFVKRSGWMFVALTWEPFSSYVLARKITGFAERFVRNLLESPVPLIELPAATAFRYADRSFKRKDGTVKRIPGFIR
jgi:hypothetical protein